MGVFNILHKVKAKLQRDKKGILQCSNLRKKHWNAIKALRNDSSIIIISADKGNKTIVLNRSDYVTKLDERIQAGSNKPIKRNPIASKEK